MARQVEKEGTWGSPMWAGDVSVTQQGPLGGERASEAKVKAKLCWCDGHGSDLQLEREVEPCVCKGSRHGSMVWGWWRGPY